MCEILGHIDVNNYGLQSMVATGGGGEVNLQSKDVTINQNGTTTIEADTGYDGLSDVDVTVSGILDTSDATATASDMALNKTAYVNGSKVTGSYVPLDTSDANATASDILPNKTAYVDGIKITGTATSDANATATDIASGKTAYVDGVKLTGTANIGRYAPSYISFKDFKGSSLNYEVANLDTSNVTNMSYMFSGCKSLTSLDVSNFNTSKVTDMQSMFNNCSSLTSLDVSNFDTSNVTSMRSMFAVCQNIASLDLTSFNTSNVSDMGYMFNTMSNLQMLDISSFDFSNVSSVFAMFTNVPTSCTIYVKDRVAVDKLRVSDSNHTYTIKPA